MLVALLLTPQRRILASRWFVVAVVVIVLLALPNFLWQVKNHFPTLEWLHDVAASDKDVKLPPVQFFVAQIMTLTPTTSFCGVRVWCGCCFRSDSELQIPRGLLCDVSCADDGAACEGLLPCACLSGIFCGGGGGVVFLGERHAWRNGLIGVYAAMLAVGLVVFLPFSIPVLPPQQWRAYTEKLHYIPKESENHAATLLPQFFTDRLGWEDLVKQLSDIYNALPRERACADGHSCFQLRASGRGRCSGSKEWPSSGYQRTSELLDVGTARVHRRGDDRNQRATLDEMNAVYNTCIVVGRTRWCLRDALGARSDLFVPRQEDYVSGGLERAETLSLISLMSRQAAATRWTRSFCSFWDSAPMVKASRTPVREA